LRSNDLAGEQAAPVPEQLLEKARADAETVLKALETRAEGLSQPEAEARLKQYGPNAMAREIRSRGRPAGRR
jgi:hypothetical protein